MCRRYQRRKMSWLSPRPGAPEITSRRGEDFRIRNPWPCPCRAETGGGRLCALGSADDPLVLIPSARGCAYRLVRKEGDHE